jgi:hypothetical protein
VGFGTCKVEPPQAKARATNLFFPLNLIRKANDIPNEFCNATNWVALFYLRTLTNLGVVNGFRS